jgi:hypothetical protein
MSLWNSITTQKVTLPVVSVIAIVSVAATLLLIPDHPARPPDNLAEFAHLTAAYLNARGGGDYHVIRATVGQEQYWITSEANARPEDMLLKHKLPCYLPRWKGTAVVFHNDPFGTIASDPEERSRGLLTTVGGFVIFGDPPLVATIKRLWSERHQD